MGNVYVNRTDQFDEGIVPPAEVAGVKAELTRLFESVTDPETGETPLRVSDGDDLFPTDPEAPDLVVEAGDNYTVSTGSLTPDSFSDATKLVADHDPEGVFLAWGEDIAAGSHPENASVFDFAPTVLHGLGEPVPDDAGGRVLTEIFRPGSTPAEAEVRTTATGDRSHEETADDEDDDFSGVEERLKGLGYME
jgi:predicted AlkP superfamily phosphohydrolase/phosphomutase